MVTRPELPSGIRRTLYRLPVVLYRWHLGALLGRRFVLIHHVGRKSGRDRQVVVEVVHRDGATGVITVASGFGPTSDWYQNLRAHPDTRVQLGSREHAVRARFLAPEESGAAMVDYAARNPKAARVLATFMGYGEVHDVDGFRAAGADLPMVALEPRTTGS